MEELDLTDRKEKFAKIVEEERIKYGTAKADIMILLASRIKDYAGTKKNIGIEMGIVWLLKEHPEMEDTYRDYIISEQKYKGAQVIIDSLDSHIIERQSKRKYNASQDGGSR